MVNKTGMQTLYVLVGSGIVTYYLFNFQSGLLGPYGFSNDVYHELILYGLLVLVYLMFQIYSFTVLKRRRS